MASFKLFGVSFLSLSTVFAVQKDLAGLTAFLGTADVKAAFSKEMVTTATSLEQWKTKVGDVGLENEQKDAVAVILNEMKNASKADEQWRTSVYTTNLLKDLGGAQKFTTITGPQETAFKAAFNAFAPSQKTEAELTSILTGSAKDALTQQMQLPTATDPADTNNFTIALGTQFDDLVMKNGAQKAALATLLHNIHTEKINTSRPADWETKKIDDEVHTLFTTGAFPVVASATWDAQKDKRPTKLINALKALVNPSDLTWLWCVLGAVGGLLLVIVVVIVLKKKGGKKGKKTGENDPIANK